ncbi:MAG: MFS transporter [Candidatus Thermoplasmatota archaeon]|nr:MFS transporter [Candidatus Thermoplasmatota archaeon]
MFKRIAAIQILANGAFLATYTYISIYADSAGLSKFQIAIMASLYAGATFFSAYVFGRFADRYGRRKVLLIGLDLLIVLVALQALSFSLFSFLTFRFLAGVGFGMFPAALTAYAFEAKAKMGKFASFGSLGWGVALLLSGVVAEKFGVYSVFLFSAFMVAGALFLGLTLKPIREVRIRSPVFPIKMIMKNGQVLLPLIVRHSSANAIWVLWPLFLRNVIGLDLWQIGLVLAVNAFTQFIFMFFIGDRLKPSTSIVLGLFFSAAAFISFTLVHSFPLFLLTQVLLGISWSQLYVGSLRSMLNRNRERATAVGLLTSSLSLSALIGPMISIAIVEFLPALSYEGPMYIAFAASLLSMVIFLLQTRKKNDI